MNLKTILGVVIIVVFVIFGSYSFFDSNLEYTNVDGAMKTEKKVQLKGSWNKAKDARFDPERTQFSFYLLDEDGNECMVVLDGAAPNNFDMATSVVAKGRYVREGHYFHATEVLTKCPSKYEAGGDQVKENT